VAWLTRGMARSVVDDDRSRCRRLLLRSEIAQKQGKQVPSRESNGKRVLPTGRLSARAPVANEDCREGVSRGCADSSQKASIFI